MSSADFFDAAEVRDAAEREAGLMAALPRILAAARRDAPAYRDRLNDMRAEGIDSREALASLPLTHKSELIELQRRSRPFGGFTTVPISQLGRVFASPGPIYEIEARRPDFFRLSRALFAAGFRAGDLIHNTFSYHLTPAGAMFESAAHALGCPIIPAGTGQTEQQLTTIADLRPVGYVGTPSFLKILLDRAAESGADITSLTKALVGAEAFPAILREEFHARGIAAQQCYGTADLGLIAYETTAPDGALCEGMVIDEGIILEIVEPGSGMPVAPGEIGEVVVTTLCPEYPLIRFATGDLSALLVEPSRCGRTNQRIKGWLGRADQSAKVRGMFVHPSQIVEILKRHPAVRRGRLVIERPASADVVTLMIDTDARDEAGAIAATAQAVTKLRTEVSCVACGTLPQDGKLIDDRRPIA